MLNYIKSQIKAQRGVVDEPKPVADSPEEVSNEVLLEYARLFQELDDLTEDGTEDGKVRKLGVDIPLDDDMEVENLEFNIGDGKVSDVPGDATVAEYQTMKTLDMFVKEAAATTVRLPRESDSMYNKRINEIANKLYNEYCIDAEETGQFGFNKISIGDNRIPSKAVINFGNIDESNNSSFMMKVPIVFATDDDHKITKKQFDSFGFAKNGALTNIGKPLMQYMESNYSIPENQTLWDIVTPTKLYVPKGNGDSFCVVLEYMNEITNKTEYFGWTRSVRDDDKSDIDNSETINMESFVEETSWENHDIYIEQAERQNRYERTKVLPTRQLFQEAIDFGGEDAGGDTESAPTPTETSENNDLPPADDDTSETSSTDDSTGDDKETAAVNNVSADIAKEVADNTKADTDDTNVTFDDDELSSSDETNDLDSDLDDLDNGGLDDNDEIGGTDEDGIDGEIDFENMTINDMLEEGSDRLKSMTLNELKDFIDSGNKEEIQEAFILTAKNINKELDINIRKCLGILNDANMNVDKIFKTFKPAGHKLNRILSRASKNSKVYSSDEQESIKSLKNSLDDLLGSLKITNKSAYVASVKQKITKFIDESKVVSTFVEDKLMGKAIQEAFIQEGLFLTPSNAKKSLVKKIEPVIKDLESIVKAAAKGKFTRGTLVKMYQSKSDKVNIKQSIGDTGTSMGRDIEYSISTGAMINIDNLSNIIGKILKRKRVKESFNSSELKKLDQINDELIEYVDFIETILADTANDKTMQQFVKDTEKLLNMLKGIKATVGTETLTGNS